MREKASSLVPRSSLLASGTGGKPGPVSSRPRWGVCYPFVSRTAGSQWHLLSCDGNISTAFLTSSHLAAFDSVKMFVLGNQPSVAAAQPHTLEVVLGVFYLSQIPLHICISVASLLRKRAFAKTTTTMWQDFGYVLLVWGRFTVSEKPNRKKFKEKKRCWWGCFVFLVHVVACFSSKESDVHLLKKNPTAQPKIQRRIKVLNVFVCYKSLLWYVGLVTVS